VPISIGSGIGAYVTTGSLSRAVLTGVLSFPIAYIGRPVVEVSFDSLYESIQNKIYQRRMSKEIPHSRKC
jgi:hypothetical protein